MRKIAEVLQTPAGHWVGDGFPVRSLFSYSGDVERLSPFLLLDYAGPHAFEPAAQPRGVGEHPHRGFETVTIVYQGEVEHLDSTGAGGRIGPGDVQWMTAGNGILHQEFHSHEFTRTGGPFEMVQLWVNLPAEEKKAEPGYQTLTDASIPAVALPDADGRVRVIAGEFAGSTGPARTRTPMNVLDIRLAAGERTHLSLTDGWTAMLVTLHGPVLINDDRILRDAQGIRFERSGDDIVIEANADATLLLLEGEPIDEPVAAYGPFVMNTQEEIRSTLEDFRSGRFGRLAG
ncbi:pirin family protein [Halofilum ochraceum]|uniref:pirin family protein n=1 Tax=Halofilum ochraceum TaxID=1611323 RepID=UPI0008D9E53C|nr:pirin family protein [Halofilum ochraceum]